MGASVNSEYLNNSLQALIQAIEKVNKTGSIITQIDIALISTLETLLSRMLTAKFNGKAGFMIDLDGASLQRPPQIHDPVQPDLDFDSTIHSIVSSGDFFSINTGRPEIFVRNVFPETMSCRHDAQNLMIATENGACIRGADNFEFISPLRNLEQLSETFSIAAKNYEGTIIEVGKNYSITISCAKSQNKEDAFSSLLQLATDLANEEDAFAVISGMTPTDAYIELVNPYINKGVATDIMCSRIATTMGARQVFSFGDSKADVPMWEEIKKHRGVSIGVGETAPEGADFYIPNYMVTQLLLRQVSLG